MGIDELSVKSTKASHPGKGAILLQSVAKVLARSITGYIGDRLPLPTPKTMLSFIHLTLRLYRNIVWGKGGFVILNTRF